MKLSEETTWALFERLQGEIAREVRVMLGEEQYDQKIFTAEQRARRVESLKKTSADNASDYDRHVAWMDQHFKDGWVYGAEFIPALKQHPNLLPWEELPANTRSKARIFAIVAQYARAFAECNADFAGTDAPSEGL